MTQFPLVVRRGVLTLSVMALLGGASAVSSQAPYVLQIPSDVRSEGMGRGSLVVDDEVLGLWGNVAGVAWGRGTEIGGSRAHLVPDLADDVFANWGVGVRLTEYVHLDMASIPQFEELDRVQKWGLSLRSPFPGNR